jgi:hypothetical protein
MEQLGRGRGRATRCCRGCCEDSAGYTLYTAAAAPGAGLQAGYALEDGLAIAKPHVGDGTCALKDPDRTSAKRWAEEQCIDALEKGRRHLQPYI